MRKELEKINNRLETIEENEDIKFTYFQFIIWILIIFGLFGGVLYYIYN